GGGPGPSGCAAPPGLRGQAAADRPSARPLCGAASGGRDAGCLQIQVALSPKLSTPENASATRFARRYSTFRNSTSSQTLNAACPRHTPATKLNLANRIQDTPIPRNVQVSFSR